MKENGRELYHVYDIPCKWIDAGRKIYEKGGVDMRAKQLKELIAVLTNENGTILEKPKRARGYEKLSDERRLGFIRAFLDLLLNTDFISEETKCYIKNKYLPIDGVAEALHIERKLHTTATRIWRDIKKIDKAFGEKLLVDILQYDRIDIDAYEQKLNVVLFSNTNVKALDDRIALRLPHGGDGTVVTQEQFEDFVYCIKPYLKTHMEYLEEIIDKDAVAYARKLLSSTILTDMDIERKELLEELLGIL